MRWLEKLVNDIFSPREENDLERFLKSKNISSTEEVNFWIQEYERRAKRDSLLH